MLAVNSTSHSHKSGHYATLLRQLVSLKQHSKDALAAAAERFYITTSLASPPNSKNLVSAGQLCRFFVQF